MSIDITNTPFLTMITNFGKSLTRTPVTKTTNNTTGDEVLTDGTSSTVTAAFYKSNDDYILSNPGLIKGADAVVMFLPTQTINKDDKITYSGETFRVHEVETRLLGTTVMYKFARLFLIG